MAMESGIRFQCLPVGKEWGRRLQWIVRKRGREKTLPWPAYGVCVLGYRPGLPS